MSTEASAVATVDSAATEVTEVQTPVTPAFDAADQHTWSREQRAEWNRTGTQPIKADSATAKKETTQADSSTVDSKSADSASDSATDKTKQEPRQKTKEDTEKRFREILDENKTLKTRLDALERGRNSDTRETKQDSQPAPETFKPLDEKEFFKANDKASYEDFVRAAARHEAKWEVKQEIAAERQRQATEAAQKDLQGRITEAKKLYPDFDERIQPAVQALTGDQQIPFAVKAIINDSPVFEHLLYALGEAANLKDLIHTAKTNPAAAIRKIVLTEQLVQAELAKATGKDKAADVDGEDKTRDASGQFVSSKKSDTVSEPKPRAPKPPSEVGGRGTAPGDTLAAAAKAGDFRNFDAEMNRRRQAQNSR